jgi:hypothetical protein
MKFGTPKEIFCFQICLMAVFTLLTLGSAYAWFWRPSIEFLNSSIAYKSQTTIRLDNGSIDIASKKFITIDSSEVPTLAIVRKLPASARHEFVGFSIRNATVGYEFSTGIGYAFRIEEFLIGIPVWSVFLLNLLFATICFRSLWRRKFGKGSPLTAQQ